MWIFGSCGTLRRVQCSMDKLTLRRLVLLLPSGWNGRFCNACPWVKHESSATRLWQAGTLQATDPLSELLFIYSLQWELWPELVKNKTGYFHVLLKVHPCIISFKWSHLGTHYFLVYLFQLLYIFRATMCPSSGELTVSMRYWYFSLCMCGCLVWRADSHTFRVKNTSVA